MKVLTDYDVGVINQLAEPQEPQAISLQSSALEIFSDFRHVSPSVVHASMTAIDVERHMENAHLRVELVVDSDFRLLGVVSLRDLDDQEFIKKITKGVQREELSVKDFMTPKDELLMLDYAELKKSTISNVLELLKEKKLPYVLVADKEIGKIVGIISTADLARVLHLSTDMPFPANFSVIAKAIMEQHALDVA